MDRLFSFLLLGHKLCLYLSFGACGFEANCLSVGFKARY